MTTSNPWRLLNASQPFDCPYFSVRSDTVSHAGGQPQAYNSVRVKLHGVAVLPIDADGCTTLVGQYRYVLDRYSWELPGGGSPANRPAIDAARRELSEETGIEARYWLKILEVPVAPGTTDEVTTAFVAWDLDLRPPHPEGDEQLSRRRVTFGQALDMALAGEIGHVSSVAAILSLHARLRRNELPTELASLLGGRV